MTSSSSMKFSNFEFGNELLSKELSSFPVLALFLKSIFEQVSKWKEDFDPIITVHKDQLESIQDISKRFEYITADINSLKYGLYSDIDTSNEKSIDTKMRILSSDLETIKMTMRRIELYQITESSVLTSIREMKQQIQKLQDENNLQRNIEVNLKEEIKQLRDRLYIDISTIKSDNERMETRIIQTMSSNVQHMNNNTLESAGGHSKMISREGSDRYLHLLQSSRQMSVRALSIRSNVSDPDTGPGTGPPPGLGAGTDFQAFQASFQALILESEMKTKKLIRHECDMISMALKLRIESYVTKFQMTYNKLRSTAVHRIFRCLIEVGNRSQWISALRLFHVWKDDTENYLKEIHYVKRSKLQKLFNAINKFQNSKNKKYYFKNWNKYIRMLKRKEFIKEKAIKILNHWQSVSLRNLKFYLDQWKRYEIILKFIDNFNFDSISPSILFATINEYLPYALKSLSNRNDIEGKVMILEYLVRKSILSQNILQVSVNTTNSIINKAIRSFDQLRGDVELRFTKNFASNEKNFGLLKSSISNVSSVLRSDIKEIETKVDVKFLNVYREIECTHNLTEGIKEKIEDEREKAERYLLLQGDILQNISSFKQTLEITHTRTDDLKIDIHRLNGHLTELKKIEIINTQNISKLEYSQGNVSNDIQSKFLNLKSDFNGLEECLNFHAQTQKKLIYDFESFECSHGKEIQLIDEEINGIRQLVEFRNPASMADIAFLCETFEDIAVNAFSQGIKGQSNNPGGSNGWLSISNEICDRLSEYSHNLGIFLCETADIEVLSKVIIKGSQRPAMLSNAPAFTLSNQTQTNKTIAAPSNSSRDIDAIAIRNIFLSKYILQLQKLLLQRDKEIRKEPSSSAKPNNNISNKLGLPRSQARDRFLLRFHAAVQAIFRRVHPVSHAVPGAFGKLQLQLSKHNNNMTPPQTQAQAEPTCIACDRPLALTLTSKPNPNPLYYSSAIAATGRTPATAPVSALRKSSPHNTNTVPGPAPGPALYNSHQGSSFLNPGAQLCDSFTSTNMTFALAFNASAAAADPSPDPDLHQSQHQDPYQYEESLSIPFSEEEIDQMMDKFYFDESSPPVHVPDPSEEHVQGQGQEGIAAMDRRLRLLACASSKGVSTGAGAGAGFRTFRQSMLHEQFTGPGPRCLDSDNSSSTGNNEYINVSIGKQKDKAQGRASAVHSMSSTNIIDIAPAPASRPASASVLRHRNALDHAAKLV